MYRNVVKAYEWFIAFVKFRNSEQNNIECISELSRIQNERSKKKCNKKKYVY